MIHKILYLIQSNTEENERILKIGYTENIEARMKTYRTHNPGFKLLKTRNVDTEGRALETYLHNYFKKLAYKDFPEWFVYDDEIILKFDTLELDEEKIYMVKNIKSKIIEYFKPKSAKELIHLYKEKDEEISFKLLSHSLNQMTNNIVEYLESLDYTSIPENFYLTTNYVISIPHPLLDEIVTVTLDRILGIEEIPTKKDWIEIYIKDKNRELEFDKIARRIKSTNIRLSVYSQLDSYEQKLLRENFLNTRILRNSERDYIYVPDADTDPIINIPEMMADIRAYDFHYLDYKTRF